MTEPDMTEGGNRQVLNTALGLGWAGLGWAGCATGIMGKDEV